MKKAFLLVTILFVSVISTACINNFAVQELNNKAKIYLEKGDYENAISRLKSSIDLDSTLFETHYNLGIAYTQAEKYPEAIDTFQNTIKIKSDFADAYYSLAVAQENYAKGIIDGSINKEKTEKTSGNIVDSQKSKELTTEEKAQVSQLFGDSIQSYTTYLEKSPNAQDRKEIEQTIENLKTQGLKYSSGASQQVTQ